MHGGDDLEDDYVPDPNVTVLSGADAYEGGSTEFDGEECEEFYGLNENSESRLSPAVHDAQSVSKKRKRREKEKEKKAKKRKLAVERDELQLPATPFSSVDAARYLSTQQFKASPKLSALELEERKIPDNCIVDTTSFTGNRTLDDLEDFISQSLPQLMIRLSQKPRANGAPTLIFIAGAALRVADVTRVLRKCRGDKGGEVAKLFARHFKLQEHVTYLKRTKVGVAVGTPARLGQLIDTEALALTALTHIIIDLSYRDAKKRSMMDIPETREEVFHGVLDNEKIRAAFRSGKTQLVLF